MPINGLYRIIVFGPTGAGKSQFCNFCQRDLDNNINEVSGSLNSCTQEPKSNIFKRCEINIELIDTAGGNDSDNNDIQNLQKVCDFLRTKEQIDFIILLLNYDDRLQSDTKDYIKTLGNIFTPKEFYTHFFIIFTHSPLKESKKNQETKKKHMNEIIVIMNDIFKIKKQDNLPEVKVYFINTEIIYDDKGNKQFDENSQMDVDKMIEKIKLDSDKYPPIDTRNLEMTGKSAKIRQEEQEKEIKELEEKLRQEEIRKKKEEEEKIKLMKIIEEKKKLEEIQRKREEELREIQRRQEEELRRLEQIRLEEQRREEENRRREQAISYISSEKKEFCGFF